MDLTNLESLKYFYPEIILSGTVLLLVILDLVIQNKRVLGPFAALGCLLSLGATLQLYGVRAAFLNQPRGVAHRAPRPAGHRPP